MTVILGNTLNASDVDNMHSIIERIPRFTYHKDFEPLPNGLKTDRNWGCCIRCGQSLLAQFCMKLRSISSKSSLPNSEHLISLFCDTSSSPFSIHSFCREITALGGRPGEWVRTSLLARVLQKLLLPFNINTVVAENGILCRKELREALSNDVPVLLLFPLMLGLKSIDMKYLPFLEVALSVVPQSIGVVGGQQGKAFYIVGYNIDNLFYFDPHTTMSAMKTEADRGLLYKAPLKKLKPEQFNSSLLMGFLITNEDDANELPLVLSASGECPIHILDSLNDVKLGNGDGEDEEWDIVQ